MEPGILCIIFFLIHDFLPHIVHILLISQPPKNLTLMHRLSWSKLAKSNGRRAFRLAAKSNVDLDTVIARQKSIGCKWVYKIKYNSDDNVNRYKAHLVAKVYTHIEGVDYCEIFSPTTKLTTLSCLLTIAATRNWFTYQLDVQNAFLHGTLHEIIYMDLPPGHHRQGRTLYVNSTNPFIVPNKTSLYSQDRITHHLLPFWFMWTIFFWQEIIWKKFSVLKTLYYNNFALKISETKNIF